MKAGDSSKNVSGFWTDYQFITNSKMRTIPKMDKEEKNTIVCNSNKSRCTPANTRVTAILFSLNCQRLDIFFSIIQIFVFSVFPVFKLHVLSTGNIIYLENFFEKNSLFSTNNSTSTWQHLDSSAPQLKKRIKAIHSL